MTLKRFRIKFVLEDHLVVNEVMSGDGDALTYSTDETNIAKAWDLQSSRWESINILGTLYKEVQTFGQAGRNFMARNATRLGTGVVDFEVVTAPYLEQTLSYPGDVVTAVEFPLLTIMIRSAPFIRFMDINLTKRRWAKAFTTFTDNGSN